MMPLIRYRSARIALFILACACLGACHDRRDPVKPTTGAAAGAPLPSSLPAQRGTA